MTRPVDLSHHYIRTKRALAEDAGAPDELPRRFTALTQLLRTKGVYTGTGHRRIVVPKDKLTEQDIQSLGFVPVTIAVPESGQDRFMSYRHPNNNYHIHSHPEGWTLHEDEHPAATMLARTRDTVLGKAQAMVEGIPHIVTEGIPGVAYYLKNRLTGGERMGPAVLEDMDPAAMAAINKMPPSPTWQAQEKAASYRLELLRARGHLLS